MRREPMYLVAMTLRRYRFQVAVAGLVVLFCGAAAKEVAAETIHATPRTYSERLSELDPGDVLRLAPGIYRDGLRLHGVNGVASSPIVVSGPVEGPQAVFVARNGRNTISLKNASFITIRHLVLDGRGRNADAVKAESTGRYAHHITLENLIIKDYDRGQQIVGISTKCPAWGWVIRGNVIENVGTGIYLGDSDGSAPFVGGLIEHNVIRGTIGYNLEIKRQSARPDVPGMPVEQRVTIIRHNIFSKASGGSTGSLARPNVLLGAWPRKGPGRHDRYLVYGNLFYQNPTEALLQATGRVAIYSNLFVNTEGVGRAVMIMRHQGNPPKAVEIFHNTIVAADIGIAVWNGDPGARQWVAANAIFAATPTTGRMTRAWNVVDEMAAAADYLRAPFAPQGELNLSPRPGRLASPDVPEGALVDYPGAERDFAGRIWSRGMAGAYVDAVPGSPLPDWPEPFGG